MFGGDIYTSTDSGVTWTAQTSGGSRLWYAVASSSDGTRLMAAVRGGDIYTSTDSGVTWTAQTSAGSQSWSAVASSSDGNMLVATVSNGNIYISTDSAPYNCFEVADVNQGSTKLTCSSRNNAGGSTISTCYSSCCPSKSVQNVNGVLTCPTSGSTCLSATGGSCTVPSKLNVSLSNALPSTARNSTRLISCNVQGIDPATQLPVRVSAVEKLVLNGQLSWQDYTNRIPVPAVQ